jgi:hypothetical protein
MLRMSSQIALNQPRFRLNRESTLSGFQSLRASSGAPAAGGVLLPPLPSLAEAVVMVRMENTKNKSSDAGKAFFIKEN